MKTKLDLSSLDKLCVSGIFSLHNHKTKKIYIGHSSNILGYVSKMLYDIKACEFQYKDMEKDVGELKLQILEEQSNIETCKEHLNYWKGYYRDFGWEFYNAGAKKPLEVRKPRVVVIMGVTPLAEVRLYNKRNEYKVVGVFTNIMEAKKFMREYYGDSNPYKYTIYSTNFLTRKRVLEDLGFEVV